MNNNWFDVWAALIRRRKNHFAIRVVARDRNLFTAAAVRYFRGAISRLCLLLQTWIGKKWRAPWEAADLLRIVNELLFCGAHTSCCRANERLSERERANRICAGCTYTREWGSPPPPQPSWWNTWSAPRKFQSRPPARTTFPISCLAYVYKFILGKLRRLISHSNQLISILCRRDLQQQEPNWFSVVATNASRKLINSAGALPLLQRSN